jgi:quercetin dioxygenase-like cupin family protein
MLSEKIQPTTLDDAPAYWFLNALHILLARNESEGGAYSLIHFTGSPGFTTPYHVHHTEDEAFYVLDGKLTVIVDGKKMVLGANAYLFLPRGVPHGFRCSGEKDSHVLTHVMPGGKVGFVGMMLDMATPVRGHVLPQPTPPDLPKLKALCEKHKIDILGPLPE